MTEKLERWLVRYAVNRIVLVPTRNTVDYVSPREKLYGRKINVDKELKHGFGDYVQVHSDNIDNSNKARTSGAIALMSSGNLEGSWYYMLLSNEQIVKRTKATSLPMPDEVITYLNGLSDKRNINKGNNTNQPVFEQNRRVIDDDGLDYDDHKIYNNNMRRFSNSHKPHSNEMYDDSYDVEPHVMSELPDAPVMNDENDFNDMPDNDAMIDDYTVQLETDDAEFEPIEHDDVAIEYDAPDVDSTYVDDNVLTYDETVDAIEDTYTVDDVLTDELPEIEQPALRRSARNHQPGRWASNRGKRNIGCRIPEVLHRLDCSYAFNMTVKDGIDKLGDIAVDSIRKETQQMCVRDVWEGVLIDSLTP